MVRDSLSSSSRMAALVFDATQAKAIWLVRSNDGGAAQVQGEVPLAANGGWLRLRRVGDTLTAFASTNGTDWSVVGYGGPDSSDPTLVGFAVGSSQAGEVAGLIVRYFQYRNYYLQLGRTPGGFRFSWYGPGTVQETSSISPVIAGWTSSVVSVQQNADERWVIFEFEPQPDPPGFPMRYFRVLAAP